MLKSDPGTYALILQSDSTACIRIGCWGHLDIRPGYYIYVGSAFGPGGIRARLLRHWRTDKRTHWHIDYLREFAYPIEAWVSYALERLEHPWAQTIMALPHVNPIQGFGCSDCNCYSHLFHLTRKPGLDILTRAINVKFKYRSNDLYR